MSDQDSKARAGFIDRWSARKRGKTTELDTDQVIAGSTVGLESADASPMVVVNSDAEVDANSSEDTQTLSSDPTLNSDANAQTAQTPIDGQSEEQAPLLSDEDMPPIPSLTAKSDLSDFFNKGVSAGLRRAALRHVFQLPVYNVRDGLNDYDDDFTKFEPLGDTITSDMKWHKARKEREAEEAAAELKAKEEQAQQELEDAEAARLEEQGEQGEHDESQSEVEATETQDDTESSEQHHHKDDSEDESDSEMDTEEEHDPVESDATGIHA